MATLEVHDGRGRVERVTIANDQPVMFGSSPKCDFVLTGEGVLPFHGRVRWQGQKRRFKVDASPEAGYLLINGQKMASSSFRQGDEIQVGENRIFMIHASAPEPPPAAPRDDLTRIQPPPFLAPPAAGAVIKRGSWREAMEFAPPSIETALAAPEAPVVSPPRGVWDFQPTEAGTEPPRGWRRLFYLFSARAYAPGQERVLSSPLVFGLGGALAVLILVGVALYGIIAQTAADRMFEQAVANLDDGDYRTAIRGFDQFLSANPKDPRAGKARVHRALANVRQYTTAAGASWTLALEAEEAMLASVSGEEAYRDSSTELDELVLKTGEALADRARVSADAQALAGAESAVGLHARIVGPAAEALLKKSRLPEKLAAARAAVRKERTRRERLAAMDAALKAGSSPGVYAARDALVAEYADQAENRDLLTRMTAANDLIRKAVTIDPSGRPGETEPFREPLGPPTSLVLRDSETGKAAGKTPEPDGPMVFALADGMAFGVDGTTGTPIWQVSVGVSSPFPPQPVAGHPAVLAFDARHAGLLRLDLRTGSLVWRQSLGGPILEPPIVLGNQVIQTMPSGKILVIDLPTGALRATIDLKMPLARTPVCDESGQVLYVLAEKDCLFVLTRDPIGCDAVEYLGHAPGSILCPPARVGRYLVVAENHRINEGRWRVFLLDEAGTKLSAVQQVPVVGWTWGTPALSGSVIWAAGDRGGLAAYAVGAYGETDPFRLIARTNADELPSGPTFALARAERELLVGSGRSGRYVLDPERGTLGATWTLSEAGPALAPPQMAGPILVLTQQSTEGPGVALWGIDPRSGAVRWKTLLGAPWSSPPDPGDDRETLTALGLDALPLRLSSTALGQGGFVESPLPRPGGFRLGAGPMERLEGEGWTAIVPALGSGKLLVRAGSGKFREVGLPAPIGSRPVAWGRELLVPGDDGRAYLIDPLTGESRAEPLIPPFDRTRPTRWTAPVLLGSDAVALADEAGIVRRLVRVSDPRPRLIVAAETSLGSAVASAPASTTGAVVIATADGQARALSIRDLSPVGNWKLDAPLAVPPATVGGRCYLADKSGGLLALGEDGRKVWSVKLSEKKRGAVVAGPPAVRGKAVWFLTRDGSLLGRDIDNGEPVASIALGILPTGGPVAVGKELAIPVGLGTLRLLKEPDGSGH